MSRSFLTAAAIGLVSACTDAPSPNTPDAVLIAPAGEETSEPRPTTPRTAYDVALDDARAQRTQAMAFSPPKYHGDGSRDQSLNYLNQEWLPWAEAKRERVNSVEDLYTGMIDLAKTDEQLVELHADLVEMRMAFWEELLRSVKIAIPDTHKNDPKLSSAFMRGFTASVEPLRSQARALVDACLAIVERGGITTVAANLCINSDARLGPSE